MDRAARYTADRRWPVDNSTFSYAVAVHQVQASGIGSGTQPAVSSAAAVRVLETEELTILTAWAEGVSEAAAYAPERFDGLLRGRAVASRARPSWVGGRAGALSDEDSGRAPVSEPGLCLPIAGLAVFGSGVDESDEAVVVLVGADRDDEIVGGADHAVAEGHAP
jgi:hypothetical protein